MSLTFFPFKIYSSIFFPFSNFTTKMSNCNIFSNSTFFPWPQKKEKMLIRHFCYSTFFPITHLAVMSNNWLSDCKNGSTLHRLAGWQQTWGQQLQIHPAGLVSEDKLTSQKSPTSNCYKEVSAVQWNEFSKSHDFVQHVGSLCRGDYWNRKIPE